MAVHNEINKGAIFAVSAFGIWGLTPLYFKAIAVVTPLDIVCHRILWSVVFLSLIVFPGGYGPQVRALFARKKMVMLLFLTSLIIGGNWLSYIWAVNNNHMMDASLGYFINPLVNVVLGLLFLGERLSPLQWIAVSLAIFGVGIQIVEFGSIPVIALVLAFSFGSYGLLRKKMRVDSLVGLFFETLVLFPIAFVYLFWFADNPLSSMPKNPLSLNLLLVAAGPVTVVPLLCFTAAAVRLRLSSLGFFQYLAPSLMFLLALLYYREPFRLENGLTFAFIWTALGVFSFDAFRKRRIELSLLSEK